LRVLLDINTPPDTNTPFGFPQNPLTTTKEASSSFAKTPPPFEEETRKNRLVVLLFVLVLFPCPRVVMSRAFNAIAIVVSIYSFSLL
jgi:hypothetical protein